MDELRRGVDEGRVEAGRLRDLLAATLRRLEAANERLDAANRRIEELERQLGDKAPKLD